MIDTTPNTREIAELPRLAFSLKEAASMLGLSYITCYRLVKRGKLKSSGGLRTMLIARTELERFLKQ